MCHLCLLRLLDLLQFQYLKLVYQPKNIQATSVNLNIIDLYAILFQRKSWRVIARSSEEELGEFHLLDRGILAEVNFLLDEVY